MSQASQSGAERFVTLFDQMFLPQGLAMIRSLLRVAPNSEILVLALDDVVAERLAALDLKEVSVLPLGAYETQALRRVKPGRTISEYCWTLTPFAIQLALDAAPGAARATYLDADLFFLRSPAALLEEFDRGSRSVLITEHAYAPQYDQSATSGVYCVQFITFNAAPVARQVLDWWFERCLEWCFARAEDGKFGDQKYLERFAELFPEQIHVLEARHLASAPWNVRCFNDQELGEAAFFHFHGLRLSEGGRVIVNRHYDIRRARDFAYQPYLRELAAIRALYQEQGWEWPLQAPVDPFAARFKKWRRRVLGRPSVDIMRLPKPRSK